MNPGARHPLLVCGSHPGHGDAVVEDLVTFGFEVRHVVDEESMIEAAASLRPRAIVYELHHQLSVDLAILALVRRVLPHVPVVVVAGDLAEPSLRTLRSVHPTVLTHEPVDRRQLRDAVRTAIRRSRIAERRERAGIGV